MEDMKDLLNFSLINIDKSAGPTSYSVSEFVRRQLGLRKMIYAAYMKKNGAALRENMGLNMIEQSLVIGTFISSDIYFI